MTEKHDHGKRKIEKIANKDEQVDGYYTDVV